MTSANPLKTIIKEAIMLNFGKNFARTFIVGIQCEKSKVVCIFDNQVYNFPFNHTIKEFKNMGKELELTEINDAWFDASFRGKLEKFFVEPVAE